jgi:hypothetical protein
MFPAFCCDNIPALFGLFVSYGWYDAEEEEEEEDEEEGKDSKEELSVLVNPSIPVFLYNAKSI